MGGRDHAGDADAVVRRPADREAGHQRHGWVFEVAHLHQKSGSLARPSDFALDLRRIASRQQLPGYLLQIEREDGRELLRIRPGNLQVHWPEGNVLIPYRRFDPDSGEPDYNAVVEAIPLNGRETGSETASSGEG